MLNIHTVCALLRSFKRSALDDADRAAYFPFSLPCISHPFSSSLSQMHLDCVLNSRCPLHLNLWIVRIQSQECFYFLILSSPPSCARPSTSVCPCFYNLRWSRKSESLCFKLEYDSFIVQFAQAAAADPAEHPYFSTNWCACGRPTYVWLYQMQLCFSRTSLGSRPRLPRSCGYYRKSVDAEWLSVGTCV